MTPPRPHVPSLRALSGALLLAAVLLAGGCADNAQTHSANAMRSQRATGTPRQSNAGRTVQANEDFLRRSATPSNRDTLTSPLRRNAPVARPTRPVAPRPPAVPPSSDPNRQSGP